jgi:peroxiredoxin (alkyl hydroperoxide reductase subunit C)
MLADTSKSLAEDLGILLEGEKVAYRVTYIADQEGIVRWVCANDLSVGRNVDEVLRVLDALQTDELCPCNWKKGDATL